MNIKARAKSFALIGILLLVFAFPGSAQAQGIVYGDTIPAGTHVDHDVVLIGQNVVLDGTVNGNVFILGNQVTINGTVDGSVVLIGQNAVIGGSVNGAVYASALTLELGSGAALARELYVVTVSLVSQHDSSVGRDLFAVSLDAGLNGRIGRTPHTAIGPIQLYNGLMTLLGFDELTIKLRIEFPPPAPAEESGEGAQAPFGARVHARRAPQQQAPFDWNAWAIARTRDWVVLSVFGLLAFAFARPTLVRSGAPLAVHPFRTTAIGTIALVIAVNLFGVALLLAALIFSIGLGLNFIGLWQLSIALWIAAYSMLALAMVALWFLVVYGTKIIVLSLVSNWLLAQTGQTAVWMKALALVLGLLVFVLLQAVPYVGWVFDVLVTAAGLGSAWSAYRAGRRLQAVQTIVTGISPTRAATPVRQKGTGLKKTV